MRARVGLFSRVGPGVNLQMGRGPEALLAFSTGIWLLSSVGEDVPLQALTGEEFLFASWAFMLCAFGLHVHVAMRFQLSGGRKLFFTRSAGVRLFPSMLTHVPRKVAGICKGSLAIFAFVRFFSGVRPEMNLQMG